MSEFSDPIYTDDTAAREHLERLRWPDGRYCPHCGERERTSPVGGEKHRPGLYYCNGCKGQFTATIGTVFERSKIPLHKWLLGFHLMTSSKKGVSAHQLHRTLKLPYKTAWFMAHRIREAMRPGSPGGLGGEGKVVEADETYIGKAENPAPSAQRKDRPYIRKARTGSSTKRAVLALVERGGHVRSFHIPRADSETVIRIVRTNISRESELMTDESKLYTRVGTEFARHGKVNHFSREYVRRDDPTIHTNTIEGYFSIFKRGMKGIYQHCGEQHLHRYLAEFDFRYNTRAKLGIGDRERAEIALAGIVGKRLTYRRPDAAANP